MSRTHRATGADTPAPRLASQRSPIGAQTDGMDAIRAVWERAADTERHRTRGRTAPRRRPRRLITALAGTLVCACLLMFFAWVSAPALWITMGHSHTGTVTVTSCSGGFAPGCTGEFTTGTWTKELRLTGHVTAGDIGRELTARTTGPDASSAYIGGHAGLLLRWAPSMALFMASGFALAAASGATRLYERRGPAIGLCWAATGAVLAAALAFAW
ncbi:hypothetical protein GCM10027447_35590 [Glycomyces halotolerans]